MYMVQFYDMDPWSMPNPLGVAWWFGDVEFRPDQAYFNISRFSLRYCMQNPWGSPPDAPQVTCYYYRILPTGPRYIILPWNENCGCYLFINPQPEDNRFESLTMDGTTLQGLYKTGVFTVTDGVYTYNAEFSIRTYLVEEISAEPFPARRQVGPRRGLEP